MSEPSPDGLLVVDKPAGWTSHDVVARCRRLTSTRRVGHAGTLDPMATGVLLVGVGRATRLLTYLVGCDKTYRATIRLGQRTETDDAQSPVTTSYDVSGVRDDALAAAVAGLTGDISQVPSSVSAIKVEGKRAYARVRAGEDVRLAARPVTVHRFDVLDSRSADTPDGPVRDVEVEVSVSSGTYVRALARDLGAALGAGGHLTALRRTRVGQVGDGMAYPPIPLDELSDPARHDQPLAAPPLLTLGQAAALFLPTRELTADEACAVGHGRRVPARAGEHGGREAVAAYGPDGTLVAVLDERSTLAKARVVFAQPAPAREPVGPAVE